MEQHEQPQHEQQQPQQHEQQQKQRNKKLQQSLQTMDKQRQLLDVEAEAILSELTSGAPPMGVDTPLVDKEGYPRNDIDIYRAKDLRRRFHEIRNDRANLTKRLEMGLVNLSLSMNPNAEKERLEEKRQRLAPKPPPKYDPVTGKWVVSNWDGTVSGVKNGHLRTFEAISKPRDGGAAATARLESLSISDPPQFPLSPQEETNNNNNRKNSSNKTDDQPLLLPFAVVDAVSPNSPASSAGLEMGDLILEFGTANQSNHRNLQAIAELVPTAANASQSIPLVVSRRERITNSSNNNNNSQDRMSRVELDLRPRPWNGRGLLGCHIVPYNK